MKLFKIAWLKIRSTYSLPLLILSIIILAFYIYIGIIEAKLASGNVSSIVPLKTTVIELLSIYLFSYSILPTNRIVSKSDQDFLFMIPVDEKELAVGIICSYLIINALLVGILIIFTAPILGFGAFALFLMFSILLSFIPIFSLRLKTLYRVLFTVLLLAWFISAYFNFPYSPLSMLDSYTYSYFILLGLTLLVAFLSLNKLNVYDLVKINYQSSRGIKNPITFSPSSSPFLIMLKKNINLIELGGRVSQIAGGQYLIARIKIYYVLIPMIVLAILAYFFPQLSFLILVVEFILLLNYAQASFINEPLWLDLSIMPPSKFARNYLLSKTLTLYILFIPLIISEFISRNISFAIASLEFPLTFIYLSSILARFYPVPQSGIQILNLRRMIFTIIGTTPVLVILFLSLLYPLFTFVVLILLVSYFFLSEKFWEKAFENAISSPY
ncbi:hypothetical protein EWF20_14635 [Sulfolobus sp. S-194]|uniref:hypothetical protein n=1 Tax=Sulfolobus sp. S-194 TaxID=2512240 RepID=UPI001436EF29|nr:hypothetical protein [Sulfolobus sp. S-194]QIW25263.1 hypothetical protein EWF20_14635 [Sulfolobus sp. S-194]